MITKDDILFSSGYAGGVKCEVYVDGKHHVLELDQVKEILEKMFEQDGYETAQTNIQKYPRISLKSMVYCAHFQCHNKRELGSDSCSGHQFCECEKLSGKHYVMNH